MLKENVVLSKISAAGYAGTISVFYDCFLRCLKLAKCLLWSRHVYMKSHGCGFQYHCSRQNSPGQSPIQLLYVWYCKYMNTLESPSAWSSVRVLVSTSNKDNEVRLLSLACFPLLPETYWISGSSLYAYDWSWRMNFLWKKHTGIYHSFLQAKKKKWEMG